MKQPKIRGPIRNSYWLVDGELLAGGYPGSSDPAVAREKLEALLAVGVRSFIDLTQPDELTPYDDLLAEIASEKKLDVSYERLSIRDMDVPTTAVMNRILKAIRSRLAKGRVVYFHCWGGVGRTGTVAGCWLVEEGHGCDDALARIRTLRAHTPEGWKQSPETKDQQAFVRKWRT
jgi:protein-tyrosine phosphatase